MKPEKMLTALGLMSGTSADGVDVALIETDGVSVQAFGPSLTVPYAPALRRALLDLMRDPARAATDMALEAAVTDANAEAARTLLQQAGSRPDVVGMHGQTVLHRPDQGFTRQLGDGEALHRALGIPVVSRFRHADVAAGGQGAPLAPAYHQALARGMAGPVALLNLGGVANVTVIDGDTMLAFDTGPASALLDDWISHHTGAPFDDAGRIARAGTVDEAALAALLSHPFFDLAPPKSLDRNSFDPAPIASLTLPDGAATLLAFTVGSIVHAQRHMPAAPKQWFVCGGGRHNAALMDSLQSALSAPVDPVDAMGWDGDALEAQAFAFLAVRSLYGLPMSWPGTTRAPRAMTGGVWHGVSQSGM